MQVEHNGKKKCFFLWKIVVNINGLYSVSELHYKMLFCRILYFVEFDFIINFVFIKHKYL